VLKQERQLSQTDRASAVAVDVQLEGRII